jgi:hypothetical protein
MRSKNKLNYSLSIKDLKNLNIIRIFKMQFSSYDMKYNNIYLLDPILNLIIITSIIFIHSFID